ncbi:MAG: hypothetical protein HOO06_00875 [Bdellovibrionaceae bacterium]|jgi:hypothetical protein|nr:hypothetical protein [Pseudobdellovibrionaceae bacterium]
MTQANNAFEQLVKHTGLPADNVRKELKRLILSAGYEPSNISVDDLRKVLSSYLQDTFVNTKAELNIS